MRASSAHAAIALDAWVMLGKSIARENGERAWQIQQHR